MSPTQQPVPQDSPESETCHTSWGGSVRKPLPNEAQVRLPDVARLGLAQLWAPFNYLPLYSLLAWDGALLSSDFPPCSAYMGLPYFTGSCFSVSLLISLFP